MKDDDTMKRLVFTGKQQVELEEAAIPAPAEDEVLVRTRYSLMSTGTENIVFNRLFDPGTHWDNWVKYPFYPGYASVGEVVAAGAGVRNLATGARVAFRAGHRSHAVAKAGDCLAIPDALPLEEAVWFALAKIAFHGALAAGHRPGQSVLVIGAGPIGQMSVRWASASGAANVLVADVAALRLGLAKAGGATAVLSEPVEQARASVLRENGGAAPDIIIDSTGNAAVFSAALGLVRDFGRVVILGDTGRPAQQHLTTDVITRGLTIVGAHDNHTTPEWNFQTISTFFFRLAVRGRFPLAGLNTHTFAPADAGAAYETANRDRANTMGILFDWA